MKILTQEEVSKVLKILKKQRKISNPEIAQLFGINESYASAWAGHNPSNMCPKKRLEEITGKFEEWLGEQQIMDYILDNNYNVVSVIKKETKIKVPKIKNPVIKKEKLPFEEYETLIDMLLAKRLPVIERLERIGKEFEQAQKEDCALSDAINALKRLKVIDEDSEEDPKEIIYSGVTGRIIDKY